MLRRLYAEATSARASRRAAAGLALRHHHPRAGCEPEHELSVGLVAARQPPAASRTPGRRQIVAEGGRRFPAPSSRGVPAVRELRNRPGRIGPPVLPAGRPRPRGEHALAFRRTSDALSGVIHPRSTAAARWSSSFQRQEPSRSTTMSRARSRVSQPTLDARHGSSRLTYQPSSKCQSEWCVPKRWSLSTPSPSHTLSRSDQSASSRRSISWSGSPAKIFPRVPPGSREHDVLRRVLGDDVRHREADVAEGEAAPHDDVALRPHPSPSEARGAAKPGSGRQSSQPVGQGLSSSTRSPSARMACASSSGEPAEADGLLELVLVLPRPASVRLDADVQHQIVGLVPEGRAAQRLLEIDVPARELASLVPEDVHAMRPPPWDQRQLAGRVPDVVVQLPLAVGLAADRPPIRQGALHVCPDGEPERDEVRILVDDEVRRGMPDLAEADVAQEGDGRGHGGTVRRRRALSRQ